MESEVLLRKLTRREFRERMGAGELKAVIIPVAAIEQHLEHLAMEHDWRSVCHVATLAAERLRPNVLVAEGLMAGISEHHMRHPGTLTLSPGTFLACVSDLIDSMARAGFQHILVLNGHGGNVGPCNAIWQQFQRKFPVNLHFFPYWDLLNADDAALLETRRVPGHAQEFETSFALAVFPENVRTDMWKDQADQEPSLSTAAKGQAMIDRTVERLAAYVQDMVEGRRVHPTPEFHP